MIEPSDFGTLTDAPERISDNTFSVLFLGTFKDVFRRNAVGKDGFRINIETDDLRENKICCRFSEYEGKERLARLSELWVDDHDYFDTPSLISGL